MVVLALEWRCFDGRGSFAPTLSPTKGLKSCVSVGMLHLLVLPEAYVLD